MPSTRTLLVHGGPGSGRTSLGLALAVASPGRKVFFSGRNPAQEVRRQFGWLAGPAGRDVEFLDESEALLSRPQHLRLGPTLPRPAGPGRRPSTPPPLPTKVQEALPQGLRELLLRTNEATPTIVVLDSLEALLEHVQRGLSRGLSRPLGREDIAAMLLQGLSRTPAHFVLLSESTAPDQTDYLVDGLVTLDERSVEGLPLRLLTVQKMRGAQRSHFRYPFTLDGGMFRTLSPWAPPPLSRVVLPEPEPASAASPANSDGLWPGCRGYADFFGTLAPGRLTIIDQESTCPAEAGETMIYPMVAHVLGQGGQALFIPPPVTSPTEVWEMLQSTVPRERLVEQLKIVVGKLEPALLDDHLSALTPLAAGPSGLGAGEESEGVLVGGRTRSPSTLRRFLGSMAERPSTSLVVAELAGIESLLSSLEGTPLSSGDLPVVLRRVLLRRGMHAVILGDGNDSRFRALRPIAHRELSVRLHEGQVYVYGVRPRTLLLGLSHGTGISPYELIRMA
ncbi:MAG: hypothetical protein KGI98_05955 [Euryarchaeota archaeon]|nr:hypothetical protein [Euryarchaeota archaeon]MDE1879119.1 hypothetical protein [Euryarchaeota archaeon]